MKHRFEIMSKDDYFVTKCCKSRDFWRSIHDKKHVWCIKCKKVTGIKLVKFWKEELITYAADMDSLFHIGEKYLFNGQKLRTLKIKARKGKITIERIK